MMPGFLVFAKFAAAICGKGLSTDFRQGEEMKRLCIVIITK